MMEEIKPRRSREKLEKVIDFLNKNIGKPVEIKEIEEATGIEDRTIRRILRDLRQQYSKLSYEKRGARVVYIPFEKIEIEKEESKRRTKRIIKKPAEKEEISIEEVLEDLEEIEEEKEEK